MDVVREDGKLHNDGICESLMGYKEWFHYQGTFFIKGKPLSFVMGFPRSFTGMGALGWISYNGKQYALTPSKDKDKDGFYDLERFFVEFESFKTGYFLWYIAEPSPFKVYHGVIKGEYPRYVLDIQTPDLHIEITMVITQGSVFQKEVFPWMPFGKRIASWFHSGDIKASLKGTIKGEDIISEDERNRAWYERMWSKVPVLWPSRWLWFMSHLDNGAVFDLYTAESLGVRIHPFDECWLYLGGKFYEFSDYKASFPKELEDAVKSRDCAGIKDKYIHCEGKNGRNSFEVDARITDFRQYEFHDYSADVKYTNFLFETKGEARIGDSVIDMKGRGAAERAPIKYWWI